MIQMLPSSHFEDRLVGERKAMSSAAVMGPGFLILKITLNERNSSVVSVRENLTLGRRYSTGHDLDESLSIAIVQASSIDMNIGASYDQLGK